MLNMSKVIYKSDWAGFLLPKLCGTKNVLLSVCSEEFSIISFRGSFNVKALRSRHKT